MTNLSLDALGVSRMASGHLCLSLSESVAWEEFPDFVDALLGKIGGHIVQRDDAADMRLWTLELAGSSLRIVFDDYPAGVSLEASDDVGDEVIRGLQSQLGGPV